MEFKDFRNGVGPYLMGLVMILLLSLTLLQVLRNAVHRGTTVKAVYAERYEAQWRCSAARGARARDDCIAKRVNASTRDSAQQLASAGTRVP